MKLNISIYPRFFLMFVSHCETVFSDLRELIVSSRIFFIKISLSVILFLLGFSTTYAQEFDLQLLNKEALFSIASILEDFDDDGDPDIIITRRSHSGVPSGVEWLENEPSRQFPRHEIFSDETLVEAADIDVCDCDNDGDMDFIISDSGNPGQLFWLQQQDDGTFIKWTIEAGTGFDQVAVADFDSDGIQDIVAVGFSQATVNLYLNDGNLNFTKNIISNDITQADKVEADDIDGDGDVDIIFGGSDARILWNTGNATFESGPPLNTWDDFSPSAARGLAITDLNNDGVKDILTFSGKGSGGLYFLDGSNNFNQTLIDRIDIDLGGDIIAADIDGNGLLDIIRQQYGENLLSILYQDQVMEFSSVILERNWDNRGPSQMSIGDLDDDGDLDLVFPENGNIDGDMSWYENIDGELHRHQIYMELSGARDPKLADLDLDGDLDIILTQGDEFRSDEEIIWFENRGVDGFVDWLIADSLDHPADIEIADLDGDGSPDLVATARDDHDLLWFRKNGVHWETFTIEENANLPLGITVADIDSDGDTDVIMTSSGDAKVFWYNNDGSGSFTRQVVDANLPEPFKVKASDLNEDGNMDLIVASSNTANPVAVYINDGTGIFTRQIIEIEYAISDLETGDWNADGRPDILVSSEQSSPADPDVWLISNNGDDTFTSEILISDNRIVTALKLANFGNGDDPDLLVGNDNATPRIRLYFNQGGQVNTVVNLLGEMSAGIEGMDTGDINGDEIMDFVATDLNGRNLMMFLGMEGGTTTVEQIPNVFPVKFSLEQNYPNPFNPVTTIVFNLEEPAAITLRIYDILGREVSTLVSGDYPAGRYQAEWDATGLGSGIYVYRLSAGSFTEAKMLTLAK